MANIDKKQKRWYSKSTFDNLDKTTIPVGTEIQVSGAIEEGELDSALQTKINGKLTTPATPAAESAVVLGADGTVSTKALTSITGKSEVYVGTPDPTGGEILWIDPNGTSGGGGSGGGKLYRHEISVTVDANSYLYFYFTDNVQNYSTFKDIPIKKGVGCYGSNTYATCPAVFDIGVSDNLLSIYFATMNISNPSAGVQYNDEYKDLSLITYTDNVTEL